MSSYFRYNFWMAIKSPLYLLSIFLQVSVKMNSYFCTRVGFQPAHKFRIWRKIYAAAKMAKSGRSPCCCCLFSLLFVVVCWFPWNCWLLCVVCVGSLSIFPAFLAQNKSLWTKITGKKAKDSTQVTHNNQQWASEQKETTNKRKNKQQQQGEQPLFAILAAA